MGRWRFVGVVLIVLLVSFGFYQKGWAEERYRVKPGDTLSGISKSFGVSIDTLKKANRLAKDTIKGGQVLVIPTHSSTLQPAQTLLQQRSVPDAEEEREESGIREDGVAPARVENEQGKDALPEPLAKWANSEERNLFVRVVKNFLGVPYRLGGSTLKGIDCSAFVKKIYEIFNTTLPRTVREQFRIGKSVAEEELQEGDLVFFNARRSSISHVGIYIGNREFVHASSQNRQVKVDSLDMPYFNKHFLRGVRVRELESDS
jgi:peptidoglycan endopeptidase LytE